MPNPRISIGDTEVVVITDSLNPFPFPAAKVFPTVTEPEWDAMRQRYPRAFNDAGVLMGAVTCYLVRTCQHTILVDTGMGAPDTPQESGTRGDLLHQLTLEGVAPEEVDIVFLTHLDPDHVGANISGAGENAAPTFPNARYIAPKADWEICNQPPEPGSSARFRSDQVLPLQTWGMLTIAEGEMEIAKGIRATSTPGHTLGHMSVWIESGDEAILLAGDAFHQPFQVSGPHHIFPLDMDRPLAVTTRLRLLEQLQSKRAFLSACHFPAPGIGQLQADGTANFWQPVEHAMQR